MHRRFLIGIVLLLFAAVVPGALDAATKEEPRVSAPNSASLREVSGKIESDVLESLQAGESTRALIVMAEQADVSAAQNLPNKQAKGRFVFETLRATAARTQPGVIAALEQQGLEYRAYYVANVIAVENLGAAEAVVIAARPEVGRIEGNPDVLFDQPVSRTLAGEAARGVEWGIQKIKADELWAMGIKGRGIVVANQDTGVQWDHPALKTHYRGFDKKTGKAAHSYSWWDAIHKSIAGGPGPCGFNSKEPCDDDGHGTHTLGTIVGGVGANKIGVAPKSRWISCRSMDRGVGRPNTYIECFEFFLAPWNKGHNHPDPDLAPDVISNSWGCVLGAPPGGEGCMPNSIKTATENIRAAGIFVAVSAGNTGSSCSTVTDPSAIYDAATTVGATNSLDALAGFSSRGPVTVDSSNRRKPDISAPGENVRSAYPHNAYAVLSGTSMAAPHVAGAVALLWQGRPALRGDVDATEAALFNTARTKVSVSGPQSCGGTGPDAIPNNLFGYGRLDVLKAYQSGQ